jgi:hypothetical protein
MADEQVKAELKALFMKRDIRPVMKEYLNVLVNYEKYGEMFPSLYAKDKEVPKRYGDSGKEI